MKLRDTHMPAIAGAKAGFSTATAYLLEKELRLRPAEKPPQERRRPDPLIDIWDSEIVPMLCAAPALRSIAIIEEMNRRYPGIYLGTRRTMERRIRGWRGRYGPEQEVIFRQTHEPGRMGLSDFTDIAQHRSDSLSAAFRNLDDDARADLTTRYDALCAHYGMEPTRNNTGVAHENGSIESSHGHLKKTVEDGVLMRGSRDFVDLTAYRRFIDELSGRHNARYDARIDIERATLQELPGRRTVDFEEAIVTVTSSSGFVLRKVFYSTPSRLIGHRLRVRLHDDRLDVYLGATLEMTLPRGRARPNGAHGHVVDYRHLIRSLRRKPMALMGLVYRDELFPRQAYRRTFDVLIATVSARAACRIMVDLLALAHERACEGELAERLTRDLDADILLDMAVLRGVFTPDAAALPAITITYMPLSAYDELTTIFLGEAA